MHGSAGSPTISFSVEGSLTAYEVSENDLDWRGTGKTLDDALKEAFLRTGIPMEEFEVTSWELDRYGKTRPVVSYGRLLVEEKSI